MTMPDWLFSLCLWCWAGMGALLGMAYQKFRGSKPKAKEME